MKLRLSKALFTAVLAAMAVMPCTLADNTLNLYILTGQSNSLGSVKGTPASPAMLQEYSTADTSNIQLWNASMSKNSAALHDSSVSWVTVAPHLPVYNGNRCMGPEFGYAYMMTKKGWEVNTSANDSIAIVKASLDGGGNGFWLSDQKQYKRVVLSVKQALNAIDASQYDSINIAGLLYLQGESNSQAEAALAAGRYEQLISDLKRDLADQSYDTSSLFGTSVAIKQEVLDKLTISLDQNVAGEPATWAKADSTTNSNMTANQLSHLADERNGISFVYTQDLNKILSGDNLAVHYDGESEITIGARYAYAMAKEKGYDITEGGTISVRSQEYTGEGSYPASGSYSATTAKTIHLNDDAAWWDGNAANKGSVIAVWDVSSANRGDTISADFAVGGLRVEDPVVHTVTINNASGSHTLSVGGSGIELQKGNLTVNTALATTADQTWTIAGERKLNITGGISGDHAVSLVRSGDSTKAGQVSVTFGATDYHAWSVSEGVEFSVMGGSSLTLDSLTLASGATLNIGGKSAMDLTINTLTGTGGTFAFNMASADSYDRLTLGSGSSLSGDYVFNISVNKKVTSTSYTLVENWTGGANFTGNIECANGVSGTLAQVGGNLVLTLTGSADGVTDYVNHNWPSVASASTIHVNGNNFYAGDNGESTHYQYRDDNGSNNSFLFFASKSSGSGDTYAELTATKAAWLASFGSGSSSTAITVDGSASLKYTGDRELTHTVYGGVNGTLSGNAYLELANPSATYTVNGLYNAKVGGKLTYILNGGTYTGVVAGVSDTVSSTVGNGVYLQIEDGTFTGAVYGGSTVAATIDGGVHMVVNGGTFNGDFLAGNNKGGIINDGVEVIINGGTFKSWVFGAGYSGTINGDIHMTISGGGFQKNNSIYAGGGSGGTTVNGNSTITLKDIANGNEFLSYTGILSGGHQNGNATGLGNGTTRTLELDNYTADSINATLTSFTEISAVNGTNTALPGTGSRGGATSISVDDTSTLKMAVEQNNMGTLHGEGRIEITGTGGNDSTAFTFGEDWTGTVAMEGMSVGGVYNFNRFGQAGSTIEVNGLGVGSGQRYIERGTYAADFVLNKGYLNYDYGMYLTDGFSSGYVTFTGKWSGDGDFYFTPTATQHFAFQGDMSDYSGKFLVANSATLDFGDGHEGVVGKSVSGTGEIKSEHDTKFTEVSYNYSNDVSAYNKITGNINLTKKGGGELTLTNANDYTGTTTVEAGTLKLESLGRTGTGNVIVKSNASLLQENFKLTGGTTDSTIVLLEGQGLGATSSDFQTMTVGAGSTLNMTGAISLVNFTTGAGFQGTGSGTLTLSGNSSVGTTSGARSTSSHNYLLTGGTTTFTNVDLTATSGNAIAVDTNGVGLNLSGTVNVSGNISAGQHNTVNITDGAQVKAGSIIYGTGQQWWSGGVSIGANALLELTDTETYSRVDSLTNNGTLHLNGTELRLHARSANGTYNMGAVEVTGNTTVMPDWYNATVNITSLTGHGDSTLTLCNDACVTSTSTFNLGTAGNTSSVAAFTGVINLVSGAQYSGTTSTNLILKEENIAANAVLNLTSTAEHANNIAVKVEADKANVAGVTSSFNHGEQPTITSTSGTKTLGLTGDGTYEAKVELNNINLDKTGSGTQTFTGDASGVGSITVSDGELVFKNAGTVAQAAVTVSEDGALTFGDKAANHVTITAKDDDLDAIITSGVAFDSSNGGGISGTGTIQDALLTITNTDTSSLSATIVNITCVNTSITALGEALTTVVAAPESTFDVIEVEHEMTLIDSYEEAIEMSKLSLKTGSTFSAYKEASQNIAQTEYEATLTLSELAATGDATVIANLDFNGEYTLSLQGTITMGSSLSLASGGTLQLRNWLGTQDLFTSVDSLVLNGQKITEDGEMSARDLFRGTIPDTATITYTHAEDGGWTVTYKGNIPEPATATLSLLALAALAARRRRKH